MKKNNLKKKSQYQDVENLIGDMCYEWQIEIDCALLQVSCTPSEMVQTWMNVLYFAVLPCVSVCCCIAFAFFAYRKGKSHERRRRDRHLQQVSAGKKHNKPLYLKNKNLKKRKNGNEKRKGRKNIKRKKEKTTKRRE